MVDTMPLELTKSARPTEADPQVHGRVADKLVSYIVSWTELNDAPLSPATCREVFLTILGEANNFDGYLLARLFEHRTEILPDTDLVGIFNQVQVVLIKELREEVRVWAMKSGIRFPAKRGDFVSFKRPSKNLTGICDGVVSSEARGFVLVGGQRLYNVNQEDVLFVRKA